MCNGTRLLHTALASSVVLAALLCRAKFIGPRRRAVI